ncbi:FUSC family protein [Lampropedia puyangensis]|nr:FUSC family protein [Lampropedia puyangensis]
MAQVAKARVDFALRDAVVSAIAAVLAWVAAHLLWGHAKPTFAAVAVVVCLAPGLPSHLKQTWSMLLGCTIGIVIAEVAWLLPEHHPMLRLGCSIFIALLLGCLVSPTPVAAIQAAVSVLLVWAMGPAVAGEARLLDVMTGAAIGLVFSQILFTTDPLKGMSVAAQKLLHQLGKGLEAMQLACAGTDSAQAEKALNTITQAYSNLSVLQAAIEQSDQSAKWSVRGRLVSDKVQAHARRYGRHAARLYGASLLLGEGWARTLAHADGAAPDALQRKLNTLVQVLLRLEVGGNAAGPQQSALLQQLMPLVQPVSAVTWQSMAVDSARWRLVDEYAVQVAQAVVALLDAELGVHDATL